MRVIEKNGLLLIPRVTDMRNGTYRSEVVFRRGRLSDILIGDSYSNITRATCIADLSASAAFLSYKGMEAFWEEMGRAVVGCRELVGEVISMVG